MSAYREKGGGVGCAPVLDGFGIGWSHFCAACLGSWTKAWMHWELGEAGLVCWVEMGASVLCRPFNWGLCEHVDDYQPG